MKKRKKQSKNYNLSRRQKIMDKKNLMNWIIAIIVAIVYLTVSIVFKAWAYSWIIWFAYAIYRFIVK